MILSALLLISIVLLIVWPVSVSGPQPVDNSELAQAVERFGEGIVQQDALHHSNSYHYQHPHDSFRLEKHFARQHYPAQDPYDTLFVDINTADSARLCLLRGIGPVFASRIVKYRALLGGFVSVDQLLEVYGMTGERLSAILPHLTLTQSNVRLIPVNQASLNELRRHPYIDYYQARAIVNYRKTVGNIHSSNDLLKINILDDSAVRKISPYIQFN